MLYTRKGPDPEIRSEEYTPTYSIFKYAIHGEIEKIGDAKDSPNLN